MAVLDTSCRLNVTSRTLGASLPAHWAGALVLLTVAGAGGARAQGAAGELIVDRVVAVVDGRVMTQSQLELEARIALIQRVGAAAAAGTPLDAGALRSALEFAIAQRLASNEADKLQAFPVDDNEVEQAIKAFKERLGGERDFAAFLGRQDADLPQVQAVLARGLRAEKLLDSKVRLRSQVSEAEVRRSYDSNAQLHAQKYESVRVALREKLARDRYQQLVLQEVAQSRRAADVRLVAPWARAEGDQGRAP